jgi:pyrimidine operon attenuation protein / uracil phosphoribosyltransferase
MNFDAETLLTQLTASLQGYLLRCEIAHPVMIGIHSGGAWLSARLHAALAIGAPLGALNISFYRDDFSQNGLQAHDLASFLPVDIDNRDVVLVDDILYTGRTVRAAMNELFDYGRPRSITLVCLISRDGRQLPIQADVCALNLSLDRDEVIKLRGPVPLKLEVTVRGSAVTKRNQLSLVSTIGDTTKNRQSDMSAVSASGDLSAVSASGDLSAVSASGDLSAVSASGDCT